MTPDADESWTKTGGRWLVVLHSICNRHMECITTVKERSPATWESMSLGGPDGGNLSPILISEADSGGEQEIPPLTLTDADGKTVEYADSGAYPLP